MILRRQRFRIIHTSERHVDGAGQVGALIGQSGSTFAAETANDVRRRCIRSWLAFDKREFIGVKSGPGDKWRAARAPASPAMAMCDTVRLPGCTITNCTTKTPSSIGFTMSVSLLIYFSYTRGFFAYKDMKPAMQRGRKKGVRPEL